MNSIKGKTVARLLATAAAIAISAVLFVVASFQVANAADLDHSDDPHIERRLQQERGPDWALRAALLGGISAAESDIAFGADAPVSVDGVGGDSWFGGARVTLERDFGILSLGPLAEAGVFADSDNAFTIAGTEIADYSADWYWKAGAIAAVEVLPGAEIFGTLAYGEIETGEIDFAGEKAGDPDLGGLVYSGGVRLNIAPRVDVFGEAVKWHDVSGDAAGVELDGDVVQVLGGVSVTLN